MKKLFLVLGSALILISTTEAFANSSKFGFLVDSNQSLNSLSYFYPLKQSIIDTGTYKYIYNKNLRLKNPLYSDCSNIGINEIMHASMIMGSLDYLSTQGEVIESTSHTRVDSDSLKLKDPNKAAFYALVPGFFVHGAGHFYAGKSGTGLTLLGVEMLSIASFCLYALASLPNENETDDNFARRFTYLGMGIGMFLGSWYYDIAKTPKSVEEYNEKLQTKK